HTLTSTISPLFFFLLIRPPPTSTLFPYTTLFRSCTDVMADLLGAWTAGDQKRFLLLSGRIDRFAEATFTEPMEGYVQRMLWALEADGVLPPGTRDRFAPRMPEEERDRVARAVRALRAG